MPRGKKISAEEIETIRVLAADHTIYEIMAKLNRPYASINTAMNRHGIRAARVVQQRMWTPAAYREFISYYDEHGSAETAERYGMQRSYVKDVVKRARRSIRAEQVYQKPKPKPRTGTKRPPNSPK